MSTKTTYNRRGWALLTVLILLLTVLPAFAGVNDLFGKKELDETERQETIERIDSIQEKLKLLQDKLRALERRKAARTAAQKSEQQSIGGGGSLPRDRVCGAQGCGDQRRSRRARLRAVRAGTPAPARKRPPQFEFPCHRRPLRP